MGLGDVTDREAVASAVAEFDEIARKQFLDRYGFGPARSYFLVLADNRYDSKAIVGAAHGFQHPGLGPLGPDAFSGGEETVAKKLRSLGFEVEKRVRWP